LRHNRIIVAKKSQELNIFGNGCYNAKMLKTLWGILIKAMEGFVTKIIMVTGQGMASSECFTSERS